MTDTKPVTASALAAIEIAAEAARPTPSPEFKAALNSLVQLATDAASAGKYAELFDAAAEATGNGRFRAAGRTLLSPGRKKLDDEAAMIEVGRLIAGGKSRWGACLEVAQQSEAVAHRLARKMRELDKTILSK